MIAIGVDILDETTLEVVDHCDGPMPTGTCTRPGPGGIVACAGRRTAATDGPEYWHLWVPSGSRHCPFAWCLEAH